MHSIHDATARSENDRIGRIDLLDELHLFDDQTNRWRPEVITEPVIGVHLVDGIDMRKQYSFWPGDIDLLSRQAVA